MARPQHPDLAQAIGRVRGVVARAFEGRPTGLLVAVSGGRDSTALLGLLECCARGADLSLDVVTFDHGLRPESAAEVEAVRDHGAALGVSVHVERLTLDPGPGLPERGRMARRAAAVSLAASLGATAIALGHTASDQAETMLLHLTRGAGVDGLAAMRAWEVPWFRPLLGFTREQTTRLCELLGRNYCDDPTNEDPAHPRVRVRQRVLPQLAAINPTVERAMGKAAEHAAEADDALRWWVARELQRRSEPAEETGVAWSLEELADLPAGFRTRLLRHMCLLGGASEALGSQVIRDIDAALGCDAREGVGVRPRSWNLGGGLVVRIGRGRLWLARGG